ncbi:HSPB1-associated protein 1 homolog isoform X2 [Palaemon carinicauda]|uniref:HSPB1-associated protein 1 homolog isoform X2 n=1 Tax=Palaemon carinicauda TaxID=392227 RepID=UPI0035B60157
MGEPPAKRFCSGSKDTSYSLKKNLINPNEIRRALFSDVKEPVVFHGYLKPGEVSSERTSSWKCLEWDAKAWGKLFGEKDLNFRLGTRISCDDVLTAPQWETTCLKSTMSYERFLQWSDGNASCHTSCGQEVISSSHWAYFDYFYMKNLEHQDELKDFIDWGKFGFPGRGIQDSTLWIGTAGANTPCHIDTYGCNLVAQIQGKKRWILFPKSQSQYLSPTRIPYEESSIYSQVGFPHPCLITHPELCSTTPYVITLEPGDVLFVPNQWWHFVENLEFSISVNTWLELPSDDEERVKEALVMYQVGSLCHGVDSLDYVSSVFNPNMISVATMTSSDLLQLLACKVFQETNSVDEQADISDDFLCSNTVKYSNISGKKIFHDRNKSSYASSSSDTSHHLYTLNWSNLTWCIDHGVEKVPKISFDSYISLVLGSDIKSEYEKSVLHLKNEKDLILKKEQSENNEDRNVSFHHLKILIDSLSDYRVIDLIKKVIDEKLQNS